MSLYQSNWAFSSLMVYESCAFRFKLEKIERLPKPALPPDNPMERGNRIHKALEDYIQHKTSELKCEAKKLEPLQASIDHLRTLYLTEQVTVEQDWWFDEDWAPCVRNDVHLWVKLDTCTFDEENGIVIPNDWKSGKSGYKAVEHIQQVQLYAAVAAIKYPWAETLIPEITYVDEGHIRKMEFTREQALAFVSRFAQRAQRIYDDRFFRPNPSAHTCRYCPYSPRGTGACPVGV